MACEPNDICHGGYSLPRSRSVSRHATLLPEESCVMRYRTAARETMDATERSGNSDFRLNFLQLQKTEVCSGYFQKRRGHL